MKPLKNKTHLGYLLIISAIIIVIIASVATLTLEMFTGGAKSTENTAEAASAFYLATSGLQVAKRDIIVNKVSCVGINGSSLYTNASITGINGQYTINSCYSKNSAELNATAGVGDTTIYLKNYSDIFSTLSSAITSSSNAIALANASSFRSSGTAKIDQEYISYTSKSGNTLMNVTRGVAGTTAASHNNGTAIYQGFFVPTANVNGIVQIDDEIMSYKSVSVNSGVLTLGGVTRGIGGTTAASHPINRDVAQAQCTLFSTAALPTLSAATGKRIINEILIGKDASSFSFGGFEPVIASTGNVAISGTGTVQNTTISGTTDPDFRGSTIVSSGTVALNGGGNTSNGSTQFSISGNILEDVLAGSSAVIPLFENIFSQTLAVIKNQATLTIAPSAFATATMGDDKIVLVNPAGPVSLPGGTIMDQSPKVIIVQNNLTLTGTNNNIKIGNANSPTILIVEGDFKAAGGQSEEVKGFTLNGLLYVKGKFLFAGGNDNLVINGFIATEGNMSVSGNTTLSLDPTLIDKLKDSNLIVTNFYTKGYEPREVFN